MHDPITVNKGRLYRTEADIPPRVVQDLEKLVSDGLRLRGHDDHELLRSPLPFHHLNDETAFVRFRLQQFDNFYKRGKPDWEPKQFVPFWTSFKKWPHNVDDAASFDGSTIANINQITAIPSISCKRFLNSNIFPSFIFILQRWIMVYSVVDSHTALMPPAVSLQALIQFYGLQSTALNTAASTLKFAASFSTAVTDILAAKNAGKLYKDNSNNRQSRPLLAFGALAASPLLVYLGRSKTRASATTLSLVRVSHM